MKPEALQLNQEQFLPFQVKRKFILSFLLCPLQKTKDFFTGCSVFVCKASDFLNISLVGLKKKLATESEMKVEWVKYIK